MACHWIKVTPNLQIGISLINSLEDNKFEQFLKRIVIKFKHQETDYVFTEDEQNKLKKIFKVDQDQLILSVKTSTFIFKKIYKFVFMPADLKSDLINIGFNDQKADTFVKVWSEETNLFLNQLSLNNAQYEENPNFCYKLSAEISSGYHKKSRIAKAYLKIKGEKNIVCETELTHGELHSIFLQFESIQNDLDNLLSLY
ncbi:unnamed protein product [Leptidea sinapis]|uniref:COMM domain-containing protein n=1 Tax=Leptidea sinapis TaxID=189913 RepID=A0A5E4QPS5_9NEOP|nr:unnamed protein product [Leptidea sinapis]